MKEPGSAQLLLDAIAIYRVDRSDISAVVDAATEALEDDLDSPSLRLLASASTSDSPFELDELISRTIDELGLPDPSGDAAVHAALAAKLRRFLAGDLTALQVTNWAHSAIGHSGPERCLPFVELDDMYSVNFDENALQPRLKAEAVAFLEGRRSPTL